MSDRQPSEEPEEQVDLEGDDDVMDDEEGYHRRRHGGEDSDEPEEEPEDTQIEEEGDGDGDGREEDAGMAVASDEPAAGSGDEMEKGGAYGPEDEEEKMKWDELLALPPQGSEVFLGGLPRDTTEEDLRELCEPLGEIFEVRLMKDKETKENKGFAFVTFTAKDVAQRAIEELHDKDHKGRTLRCSLSQAKHRLFVGNVPKGLSEEELTSIIKGKGPGVVNIEMFKDLHDPSRNRGFLFVEYYNHACADYARQKLSSPDFKVDGSQLTVSWAEPKGSSSSSSDSSSAAQVKTIYVKNLPENVSKDKVKDLFEVHGEVTKIVLPPAKAGHKRDFGFVHFAERSSALKAVKGSEKYEIDGQVLEVSMAKPLSDKKPDHSFKPGGAPSYHLPPYGGYMGDPYGAYGGGPGFNQPMIYGRGPAPAGMRMVPMVLPDGRLGYVL